MRIHNIHRNECAGPVSGTRPPWLDAAFDRLLELPDHPQSRVLVAAEGERIHAILGLELAWSASGRLENVTIRVLEIDPGVSDRGIGSRLIRVAEDIAHINGCERVCTAPGLERLAGGSCRITFGRFNPGGGPPRTIVPPRQRGCA